MKQILILWLLALNVVVYGQLADLISYGYDYEYDFSSLKKKLLEVNSYDDIPELHRQFDRFKYKIDDAVKDLPSSLFRELSAEEIAYEKDLKKFQKRVAKFTSFVETLDSFWMGKDELLDVLLELGLNTELVGGFSLPVHILRINSLKYYFVYNTVDYTITCTCRFNKDLIVASTGEKVVVEAGTGTGNIPKENVRAFNCLNTDKISKNVRLVKVSYKKME